MLGVVLASVVSVALPVVGGEDAVAPKVKKEKKEKKAKPELEEVTISGVIARSERPPKKEGGKAAVIYVLTDTEGNAIKLPRAKKIKKGKDAAPAVDLDAYLDTGVTVVAKATKRANKLGKDVITVKKIISIKKRGDVAEIDVFGER